MSDESEPVSPEKEDGGPLMLKTETVWNRYPQTTPNEMELGIIIYTLDGLIEVFYSKEDAAHDHSPWQHALAWVRLQDLCPKEVSK